MSCRDELGKKIRLIQLPPIFRIILWFDFLVNAHEAKKFDGIVSAESESILYCYPVFLRYFTPEVKATSLKYHKACVVNVEV